MLISPILKSSIDHSFDQKYLKNSESLVQFAVFYSYWIKLIKYYTYI